jgi:hypothetical protein
MDLEELGLETVDWNNLEEIKNRWRSAVRREIY